MRLIHKETGRQHQAIIELVENDDWKVIDRSKQFGFKWIKEKQNSVYKIRLELEEEVLGLISIEDIPKELRIHICLIEVNGLDLGRTKRYDHIAGCLLAFMCRLAFKKGYEGYVSLYSKTELSEYYQHKYGFKKFGNNLYTELANSERLIQKYIENG